VKCSYSFGTYLYTGYRSLLALVSPSHTMLPRYNQSSNESEAHIDRYINLVGFLELSAIQLSDLSISRSTDTLSFSFRSVAEEREGSIGIETGQSGAQCKILGAPPASNSHPLSLCLSSSSPIAHPLFLPEVYRGINQGGTSPAPLWPAAVGWLAVKLQVLTTSTAVDGWLAVPTRRPAAPPLAPPRAPLFLPPLFCCG
jgi:hypothetical protein